MSKAMIAILVLAIFFINTVISLWLFPSLLTLCNLLFIEGGLIFAVGAFIALGVPSRSIERPSSLFASPGGHVDYLRQRRRKQFSFGLILMLIGASLLASSIVIGEFLI